MNIEHAVVMLIAEASDIDLLTSMESKRGTLLSRPEEDQARAGESSTGGAAGVRTPHF